MRFREGLFAAAATVALTVALAGPEPGTRHRTRLGRSPRATGGVTDQMILDGTKNPANIVSYGLGPEAHRFSPIKTLNKSNIKGLIPAWSFSFGGEKQRGQESQALVYDGIIYVTGSYSRAYAINSHTGEKIWEYDARLPEGILPCCDGRQPWRRALPRQVHLRHTRLQSWSRWTSRPARSFGKRRSTISRPAIPTRPPPLIVKNKVITGVSGGEFGVIGKVQARDADTGELVWSRPVIEGNIGELNGKPSTMTGTPQCVMARATPTSSVAARPGSAAPMIRS